MAKYKIKYAVGNSISEDIEADQIDFQSGFVVFNLNHVPVKIVRHDDVHTVTIQ